MRKSLWFVLLPLGLLAMLTAGCESLKRQGPSDLPAIKLTLTPSAGKAPLQVDIAWDVQNASHCTLNTGGGLSDVPCVDKITRTFIATTGVTIAAVGKNGNGVSRTETVVITP